MFCPPGEIDWPKCQLGEKRWDAFCAAKYPGKDFLTPKTDTLERMADCSEQEFSRLAASEVKASRKYWQNRPRLRRLCAVSPEVIQ
ncbi:hypothetical protein RZS08_24305, partial [Arthrospira platensis SPKY1]|nr:hypothetical protein [Arthrospira platensis SPKY1]